MEYRILGKTGLKTGVVGLGMEHLQGNVSRKTVIEVVHEAVEHGMNYFDLLASSPDVIDNFGEAFKDYRDKVILAGHLGIAETNGQYRKSRDPGESEVLFYDLLARLDTDHVDVLHLHNIDEEDDYNKVKGDGGLFELATRLKKEGKARFISLSGHNAATSSRAVNDGIVDVLMHPVNILWDPRGKRDLLDLCKARGVGVVAMKTFAGGAVFTERIPVTPVQCISYSLSHPAVSTVVAGVRNKEELAAALEYLDEGNPRGFEKPLADIQKDMKGMCVYCNHCLPCTAGIDIGMVNSLLASSQYGLSRDLVETYEKLDVKASECVECGECEERCPFGVEVVSRVRKAAEIFG